KQIAYLGFDDRRQGYQVTRLYVMNRDGSSQRVLSDKLDRDVRSPVWSRDGKGLFFQYDDRGDTRVGLLSLDGNVEKLAGQVGGTTLDRPYASGSFSVAEGTIAFTQTGADFPAEVAVRRPSDRQPRRLTAFNANVLGHKALGKVEEVWY